MSRLRVVIVGGGFAGLAAARGLDRSPVDVLLIDRTNHHLFQPLLYQVATGGLSPAEIAQPIRAILQGQKNLSVLMADVVGVEEGRLIVSGSPPIPFDRLILATGLVPSWFGNESWPERAPGLKSLDDALELRARILGAFERAEAAESAEERERRLCFVVVGGGPTGVEMAGAVAELARRVLRLEFDRIADQTARVVLVEAGPRLLPMLPEPLGRRAADDLRALGVEVLTETRVEQMDDQGVETTQGRIEAATVVWAAGLTAEAWGERLAAETDRMGRIVVDRDFRIPGRPGCFAIGDVALWRDSKGAALPGVSPAAKQAGTHVAKVIQAELSGGRPPEFRYLDKGTMATIGRSRAVGVVFGRSVTGFLAWLLWLAVHILYLVGFRSKLLVFFQWVWSYLLNRPGVRLITGRLRRG
ncbi:MAG: NAD(P)/FAD-dependent oxidoreductase [Fimbriimonadaceae bacterium]|nr:NAD(P)/FAD-dependent oxidoreductase [Fimbriimonadaceae bacterium]